MTANAQGVPEDGRDETPLERLDRNWSDILQELRVIQTGTQILTGFLLTVAFQQRFADLVEYQVDIYIGLVIAAGIATVLGLAPVALHRGLWARHAKREVVHTADVLLKLALGAVALTLAGTVLLIFDLVLSLPAGIIAGAVALVTAAVAWVALPLVVRREQVT
jgi:hypothetical protein